MFVRVKTTPNSPRQSVQIVESARKGSKITQRIIRYVGIAQDALELKQLIVLAETIKLKMEQEAKPSLFPPEELEKLKKSAQTEEILITLNKDVKNFDVNLKDLEEESRVIEGIHCVYGKLFDQLGLGTIFSARQKNSREIFKEMTLARLASPRSKLASAELLQREFGKRLNVNAIYRMMDNLDDATIEKLKQKIYQNTCELFPEALDVVFFDATTLYFEAFEEDDLRKNGYSKDLKFNQPQILLALMVTKAGLPIGYELFPSNQYEGHTLIPCLEKLKEQYKINRVIFVADSGLFNADNLEALEKAKFEYIVGARLRSQTADITNVVLNKKNYQTIAIGKREEEKLSIQFAEINHPYGRLIVSYSEKRAKKDKYEREKSIAKLKQKLEKQKQVQNFLSNFGYKKFLKFSGNNTICLNAEKIKEEEKWNGLKGIITNSVDLSPQEAMDQYRGLWQVEEAFRLNKHDLKIRPIFHYKDRRIKAHVAILFAAFSLMKHLYYRVKLQSETLSPEKIKEELLSVQTSIYYNKKNGLRYALPSRLTEKAKKIFAVLGLKRILTPRIISVKK